MPAKVPVPRAKASDDAVVYAARAKAVARENGERLDAAARNYEAVAARFAGEEEGR